MSDGWDEVLRARTERRRLARRVNHRQPASVSSELGSWRIADLGSSVLRRMAIRTALSADQVSGAQRNRR